MFNDLSLLADDPILGLMALYAKDSNPNKVDLGVGVYKNNEGEVVIMESVRAAERSYLNEQITKSYQGIAGDGEFTTAIEKLIYGCDHSIIPSGRMHTLQTPGSCGGLFLAAQLLKAANPKATLWVSDPTWGNHYTIFEAAGITVKAYPYYDNKSQLINFSAMQERLHTEANAGDTVLLHGCCHNPSGADLTFEQWQAIATLLKDKNLTPLVDQAYQGYGQGLREDSLGIAHLANELPEMLVSYSCSKNFSLYRERTGALSVIAETPLQADAALSHLKHAARASYSMPPGWGANLVKRVLGNPELGQQWAIELDGMRQRIADMRSLLAEKLNKQTASFDANYLSQQRGMFSFLPLNADQINTLREQHGVYIVANGRLSFTGLSSHNIDYAAKAIAEVSKQA